MQNEEMRQQQMEKWTDLTIKYITTLVENSDDVTKKDIIKIAQKVEDLLNVVNGSSKIDGWRF